MKIICDTNIWYGLGDNSINLPIQSGQQLVCTMLTLDEILRSEKNVFNPEKVKGAFQCIFKFSGSETLFEPPFVYIKKLSNMEYLFDIKRHLHVIMSFSEAIANGAVIEASNAEEFMQFSDSTKSLLQEMCNFINFKAIEYKHANIHKKVAPNSILSKNQTRELINAFVSRQTHTDGVNDEFDWSKIELFETAFRHLLANLQNGAKILKPNDWVDYLLLTYVSPSDKFWTNDTALKKVINDCGMGYYLFEN